MANPPYGLWPCSASGMNSAMNQTQRQLARDLAACARSLFQRGYCFGTAGNLSARNGEALVVSPTNSSFEDLHEEPFAIVRLDGKHKARPAPSKQAHFHVAIYEARWEAPAVIHHHSAYTAALSCLRVAKSADNLPAYARYSATRITCLPVAPHLPPGHPGLSKRVHNAVHRPPVLLVKNQGPMAAGRSIREASAVAEELEQQAHLYSLLTGRGNPLNQEQLAALRPKRDA